MTQADSVQLRVDVPAEVRVHWNVRIPLRDGTHLSAMLYLPIDRPAPTSAIVTMTPYIAQSHHGRAMYFARQGYPFLSVNVRGRGDSDGMFHPLNEACDGHDVVGWLARQPYCNGKVGMWGASYLGYCQWLVAGTRPRHLVSIVPVAAPYYGVDVPMRNNIFVPYQMRWLTMLHGRTLHDRVFADESLWRPTFARWFRDGRPFKQLDEFVAHASPLFQEWIAHPQCGEYWDRYNPTAQQYAQMDLPILTITGAYDADQPGALEHYRRHMQHASPEARARHYLIIGPWDHSGTSVPADNVNGLRIGKEGVLDLMALHLQWYAWTMQGGEKPAFLRRNVAYYVTAAEGWRYADTLDAITARTEPFFLCSGGNASKVFSSGELCAQAPCVGPPDRYVYDPRSVDHVEIESTLDPESLVEQRMIHALEGQQLVYHSAPLSEDLEIAGFFKLSVWLAIDQPDTDFMVTIHEIGLDGGSVLLTSDWLRARYRKSLHSACLVETQAPLRYDFERFTFVARRIRKHHRLRLVIGPINSMHWQKNYNTGGVVADESMRDARVVTVCLFHDEAHPSVLQVPIASVSSDA